MLCTSKASLTSLHLEAFPKTFTKLRISSFHGEVADIFMTCPPLPEQIFYWSWWNMKRNKTEKNKVKTSTALLQQQRSLTLCSLYQHLFHVSVSHTALEHVQELMKIKRSSENVTKQNNSQGVQKLLPTSLTTILITTWM